MRSIWNGAVTFGLVSVAVRVYTATTNHDIRFRQVHGADGGRIRYKRFCEVCGDEVAHADIVKGYETDDGELVTLDDDDMATLPTSTGREIEVVEFVPAEQVDPLLLDRSYFLEPDPKATKPYALLREALREADRMAVATVALRQRQTLALLRVRGAAIVMQTMLWPDEVREPDFETSRTEAQLRPQELAMAASLVDTMAAEFDPTQFDDEYRKAVENLIDYKRQHGGARPVPAAAERGGEEITDLLTALQRSVEEASGRKVPAQRTPPATPKGRSPSPRKPAKPDGTPPAARTTKPAARKPRARKPDESDAPVRKAGGQSRRGP
ncbi:MAG: Ku protein [Pseudonocardiaceae bacterium]|nr:Ku protein [Pseudonocardiaceae bacterium]